MRPALARRGHREVAGAVRVGGEPAAASAPGGARDGRTRSGSRAAAWRHWVAEDLPALLARGARVIASVWGHTVDDYRDGVRLLAGARADLVAVEVNLALPEPAQGGDMFANTPARPRPSSARLPPSNSAYPCSRSSRPASPIWRPSPAPPSTRAPPRSPS